MTHLRKSPYTGAHIHNKQDYSKDQWLNKNPSECLKYFYKYLKHKVIKQWGGTYNFFFSTYLCLIGWGPADLTDKKTD